MRNVLSEGKTTSHTSREARSEKRFAQLKFHVNARVTIAG
jgi:hypothetical protein